ncbi:MAG: hypothetical protein WBB34_12450 [Xanthobacteraceae bacterium]
MRIWRYIDLPKLISMLSRKSLFFACPNDFDDPFEGYLPRSHVQAHTEITDKYVTHFRELRAEFGVRYPGRDLTMLDDAVKKVELGLNAPNLLKEVATRFGVNCWHKNETESAAMWELYGNCIAVESSVARLQSAFNRDGVIVDEIRYMDFDKDPIDKGHRHYSLFLKRREFRHEQEVRATILLKVFGKGEYVDCDIEKLVAAIHVAPGAPPYYADAVRQVVAHVGTSPSIPVLVSPLFNAPDY